MKDSVPIIQTCKNCESVVENKYCASCGQKTSTSRFTMKHLLHDFIHGFFHIDHGIFYTILKLAQNPGRMLRSYLQGHRVRYFNPFTFILLLGGISAFLLPKIHWRSYFIDIGVLTANSVDQEAWNSSLKHFSLRLLLGIPLYAIITKGFYFRKEFNFSEHLIANTFIRGELCVLMILVAPLELVIQTPGIVGIYKTIMVFVLLFYVAWAYAGLFDGKINIFTVSKGFIVILIATFIEMIILNLIVLKKLPF